MSVLRVSPIVLLASVPMLLVFVPGCGDEPPSDASTDVSTVMESNPELFQELQGELNRIINETTITYQQLDYDYAEDLLDRLDQYEAYFASDEEGDPPRFLPKVEPEVELAHIRESIRRWETQTGKTLREEVDELKADVAARTGEVQFYPEFQKKFSLAFDDFIKIEVAEMLERRNQIIHEEADALFAPYRDEFPMIVRHFEAMLSTPQFAPPEPANSAP